MQYYHLSTIDLSANLNNRVFGIFMAHNVEVKQQKNGQNYISLKMCDKDVKLDAKKFGATDAEIAMVHNGGIYCAAIDIKPYNGSPSYVIYNIDISNEDPSTFLEFAEGMEHAVEVINDAFAVIRDSIYWDLVYGLINDNWTSFTRWSAARSMHHDMLGGLLVHTAEVIEQSKILATYWQSKYNAKFINMPLLLSGALIHDIGKITELAIDETGNTEYSTQAALESHITACVSMLEVQAYKIGFGYAADGKTDEQLKVEKESLSLLKHIVLSHHGKLEYGSPITPNIPEALLVNIADGLSAEMFRFNKTLKQMETETSKVEWLSGRMVNTYKDSTKAN